MGDFLLCIGLMSNEYTCFIANRITFHNCNCVVTQFGKLK